MVAAITVFGFGHFFRCELGAVLTLANYRRQALQAEPKEPPAGLSNSMAVNWWDLLKSGFDSSWEFIFTGSAHQWHAGAASPKTRSSAQESSPTAESAMTRRDEEIVTALSLKVRYFSLEQIAGMVVGQAVGNSRGSQANAAAQGRWLAHACSGAGSSPARPGQTGFAMDACEPGPGFCGGVPKAEGGRWKMPARETELFLGTAKARGVLGGKVPDRVKNLCQTTQDLHVAEVFLHYRRNHPSMVETWVGEDEIASQEKGIAVPDASFRDAEGSVHRAIEFGGSYSASRVSDFHTFCVAQQIPYEMW